MAQMTERGDTPAPPTFRTGLGIDIHAYSDDAERPMYLAGLHWPGEIGLKGHSDADVVAHAICDAILLAAGLGDLGTNFGVAEPEWAGASGAALLSESVRRVREAGWQIANVVVQVVCERPRLAGRRAEAEQTLSQLVQAPVSFGATTSDHLGFTGRAEGAAALATALVYR